MRGRGLVSTDKQVASGRTRSGSFGLFLVLAWAAAVAASLVPVVPAAAEPTDDPDGTQHIVFVAGREGYVYRWNRHAGSILILTGKVRNNYAGLRSFIKIRGSLLTADDKTLADQVIYAGNVLSEEELIDLPLAEILSRLQVKSGRDNVNVNIPSGTELPFMLVFDNLPEGLAEYRVDPVSSEPAD